MQEKIFKYKKINNTKYLIYLNDENHPIFKAHFPKNPILPGFIYFNIFEEIFNQKVVYIKRAKFLNFSKPNDILELSYEKKDDFLSIIFSNNNKNICMFLCKTKLEASIG